MSKLIKIGVLLILVAIGAAFAWNIINKEVDDFVDKKPAQSFTFQQMSDLLLNDTSKLSSFREQLIAIEGVVKKVSKQDKQLAIEIGDSTTETSIVCQVDERHVASLENVHKNQPIKLKGKMTGFQVDTEMGIFNTIEMNYCTLNK